MYHIRGIPEEGKSFLIVIRTVFLRSVPFGPLDLLVGRCVRLFRLSRVEELVQDCGSAIFSQHRLLGGLMADELLVRELLVDEPTSEREAMIRACT